jgi:hypothetical protein
VGKENLGLQEQRVPVLDTEVGLLVESPDHGHHVHLGQKVQAAVLVGKENLGLQEQRVPLADTEVGLLVESPDHGHHVHLGQKVQAAVLVGRGNLGPQEQRVPVAIAAGLLQKADQLLSLGKIGLQEQRVLVVDTEVGRQGPLQAAIAAEGLLHHPKDLH